MKPSRGAERHAAQPAPADRQGLGVEVLVFLAADDERLARFLALTGATPQSLRRDAGSPALADAVLSYLAADEALLVTFATEQGYLPETVGRIAQGNRDGEAFD